MDGLEVPAWDISQRENVGELKTEALAQSANHLRRCMDRGYQYPLCGMQAAIR